MLDHAIVSSSWLNLFPQAFLKNSFTSISNHSPIVLIMDTQVEQHLPRLFRFENKWFYKRYLHNVVETYWGNSTTMDIVSRLGYCYGSLVFWIKNHQANFKKDIR